MKLGFTTVVLLIVHLGYTQVKQDTVQIPGKTQIQAVKHNLDSVNVGIHSKLDSIKIPGDGTTRRALLRADSIRSNFQSKADSLQSSYRSPINQLDSVGRSLQHGIDSLHSLKLPTDKLTTKLDTVNKARTEKVSELNQKVNQIKANASSWSGC
jgi:seryl-tRNA synthetase